MYLKTKIAEVHHTPNDGDTSCYSEPNGIHTWSVHSMNKTMRPIYHAIEHNSAKESVKNESRASVYYTPNDSVDPPQLQLSPLHINVIQENLNIFPDYLKPSESICKFDFNMHRISANFVQEIDKRRQKINLRSDDEGDDDDDDEETIDVNMERIRMLTINDSNSSNATFNSSGNIQLNTLPKQYKCKRTKNDKDFYYSLGNVLGSLASGNHTYQVHMSNKTIDETSCEDTLMTSSASDNCSSFEQNRLCPIKGSGTQSVLVLNEAFSSIPNKIECRNSMPNISQ